MFLTALIQIAQPLPDVPSTPWVVCTHRHMMRFVEENESAHDVAQSAIRLCQKEEGIYWSAMFKIYQSAPVRPTDPKKAADDYIERQRREMETDLISEILDYRATLKGK